MVLFDGVAVGSCAVTVEDTGVSMRTFSRLDGLRIVSSFEPLNNSWILNNK